MVKRNLPGAENLEKRTIGIIFFFKFWGDSKQGAAVRILGGAVRSGVIPLPKTNPLHACWSVSRSVQILCHNFLEGQGSLVSLVQYENFISKDSCPHLLVVEVKINGLWDSYFLLKQKKMAFLFKIYK